MEKQKIVVLNARNNILIARDLPVPSFTKQSPAPVPAPLLVLPTPPTNSYTLIKGLIRIDGWN